jgi:hypothetical protein
MFMSCFILVFSAGALAYWVRSTIVTILDTNGAMTVALRLAEANRLEFPMVRQALAAADQAMEYGRFAESLRNDFTALTYLLRFAATVSVGKYTQEERLLVMDFHVMRILGNIGSAFSPRLAHFALSEMTAVLERFAAIMGNRMSTFAMDMAGA